MAYKNLTITEHAGNICVITMRKPPENRIDSAFAQELIRAFRDVEIRLTANGGMDENGPGGAVITRGSDEKFWCTGLDLHESDGNPFANSDGFYPLLATILDFPYPTIALLTGHTFGGAVPFALSHDYRIMNASRGFLSMPPVNLGLHFSGIGSLPRLKLSPVVARRMLLEAHRWTGVQALEDGIVDAVVRPAFASVEERRERRDGKGEDPMGEAALSVARKWAGKARMGVYAALREELWGQAARSFREISYRHGRETSRPAKAKI